MEQYYKDLDEYEKIKSGEIIKEYKEDKNK